MAEQDFGDMVGQMVEAEYRKRFGVDELIAENARLRAENERLLDYCGQLEAKVDEMGENAETLLEGLGALIAPKESHNDGKPAA